MDAPTELQHSPADPPGSAGYFMRQAWRHFIGVPALVGLVTIFLGGVLMGMMLASAFGFQPQRPEQ